MFKNINNKVSFFFFILWINSNAFPFIHMACEMRITPMEFMAMLEIKMHWWKWKINSNIYQRSNGIISQTITSNPAKNVKMIQTWNHFRRTGRSNDKMHIIQWSIETGGLRHTDKISVLWRSSLFVTSLYRYTPHACKTLPQKRNLYPLTRGIFWVLGEGEYR